MNLAEASNLAKKTLSNQWVKWIHRGSAPANTATEKNINVIASSINPKHCASCLNINGCCFVKDKSPENPLHENCHCYYEDIGIPDVKTLCAVQKFTDYIFNEGNDKGKKAMFESWGYTILDSYNLKENFEKQAQLAYQCGEYELAWRDGYGQRINIAVQLKKQTGESFTIVTGWMTYPDGRLVLATPYGRKR
ncbi:MAG: hypothetical protein J6036_04115 [Clostridia bacterium]|nr:hypothetical protein [Clostridia bacterium]